MSDETNEIDYSLILPTRERLPKFRRLCDSVAATCFKPKRIEMWACIDWDDAEMLGNKPDLEASYP